MSESELPDGEGWAMETMTVSTHNGTHMDAPYHFHSTMSGGKRAITIDEVPLHWCFNPGVKLDFRHFEDGYVVQVSDIEAELDRISYVLQPLDIVLINTSAEGHYGSDDFVSKGCGIGREATVYLLDKGVRLTGTDGWSWDAPFVHTAKKYADTKSIYILHPNGETERYSKKRNIFETQPRSRIKIYPGSIIFVPKEIDNSASRALAALA